MDRQRYIEENKEEKMKEILSKLDKKANINPNNINYRLMQEWEVPEWVKGKKEDPDQII